MKGWLLIWLIHGCFGYRWWPTHKSNMQTSKIEDCLDLFVHSQTTVEYYGLPGSFECTAWVCSLEESANELIHCHPKGIAKSDWMRSQSDYHMDALLSLKEFTSLGTHCILRCFVTLSIELPFVASVIFLFTTVVQNCPSCKVDCWTISSAVCIRWAFSKKNGGEV